MLKQGLIPMKTGKKNTELIKLKNILNRKD